MGGKEERGADKGKGKLSHPTAALKLGLSGTSGSGKTTLARRAARALSRSGRTVSYVKTTHHPLNDDLDRGDTGRLLRAGACEAFLVRGSGAVHFDPDARTATRLRVESEEDLVARARGEIVLIEGWKERGSWPRVTVASDPGSADAVRPNEEGVRKLLSMLGVDELPDRKYAGIVFDLDGTLVDSWDALHLAVNAALAALSRPPIDRDQVIANVGEGVEPLIRSCLGSGREVPSKAMEVFVDRYGEECCGGSRPLEGVMNTLKTLDANGISMAVCTNKPVGFSARILEALGMAGYFNAIVGPESAGERKPAAAPVLLALESLDVSAEETLFVGDMPIDVEAARAARLDVAVLPTGSSTHETLVESDPDYLLDRFEELLHYV